MKRLASFALACAVTFSLITPVAASSSVYTVPKHGKVKAGVYENGKLLVAAKNTKEIQPINDALRVKSTLFYTELHKGETVYQCGGMLAEYNVNMKQGKLAVKTMKDRISNLTSGITTDGTSLYYAAITGKYTNDLVRLSADGKSRKVLVKGIEDVWYAQGNLYYVKSKSIYAMNPKTLKATQLSAGKGQVYPQGPCSASTYSFSPNAIMLESSDDNDFSSKSKVRYVYEYKTKKTHTLKVKGSGGDGYVEMMDVDLKNKRYVNLEFDGNGLKLVLVDYNGKKIKDIHKLTHYMDWENSLTWSRAYEGIDAVKKQMTYVNGTKLATKKF